jgi:ribonuclease T
MPAFDLSRCVSVDVETSGPIPGVYSLLSIGACLVADRSQTFYAELKPVPTRTDPRAMAVHGLDLEKLKATGLELEDAMLRFETWTGRQIPDGRSPVFVSYNAPFDWMFIQDAFQRSLGRNPYGHFPLDIRAFYAGKSGLPWDSIRFDDLADHYLGHHRLSHNALEDACAQGELFERIVLEPGPFKASVPVPRGVGGER